jgi:ribonuclease HII
MPIEPNLNLELPLWASGLSTVAGIDEAGRGAWAGPVAAAAVILPPGEESLVQLRGVRDSKLMTPRQRAKWAPLIRCGCLAWGVGFASSAEIDALGILPATRLAMCRALEQMDLAPQHLLIDAVRLPGIPLPQTSIIKGDRISLSIAAASVLAKTERDALMVELAGELPGFGFERHKGYGTHQHQAALELLGPSDVHRKSFSPIKNWLQDE